MLVKGTALVLGLAAALALVVAKGQVPTSARQPASPADPGRGKTGVEMRVPKTAAVAVRAAGALRVERVEAHALAEGTHAGAAGDVLLTFQGRGFLETALSPSVTLGKVVLDDTMVNREGTELYVVVPKRRIAELAQRGGEEILVANPGAQQPADSMRVAVRAKVRELLRPPASAPKARLVFSKGSFARAVGR